MSDATLLRALLVLVALYGCIKGVRGEWSGAALCLGVAGLALAS